MIVRQMLYTQ